MDVYLPSKEDLEQFITTAVKRTVEEALPNAIRKATRPKWLNTDDVMAMLKCSRRHVQYLRDTEQLPFRQNARTIRYDVDEVEKFLNNHKVKSRHDKT